jgi:DNA repair protein RadA/Sms
LEHNADAVLLLRKSMNYRLLFLPKNRFGPAMMKPLALEIDPETITLRPSPHAQSVTSVARTYLAGYGEAEVQAAVSLSMQGGHARVTAPNLPRREIEQIVECLRGVPGIELDDLNFTINCRIPGSKPFTPTLGLPLAMALVSSYVQRPIPLTNLYIGEIDLTRAVRVPPQHLIDDLAASLGTEVLPPPQRIFCAPAAASVLPRSREIEIVPCRQLADVIYQTWTELR